jgi:glycosyltransferase involved in cell wall biosynthesis
MLVHGRYPIGEPRVAREARAALDAGWEVDIVAMRNPGEPAEEKVDGAAVVRLPLAHRRGAGALAVVREYLGFTILASLRVTGLAARRRYDVVHVNNPPDFLALGAVIPKLLGSKVIFDVHDLSPEMFAMRFGGRRGSGLADRVLRLFEAWTAKFADAVVTVHEPYRRELAARGVPLEKITVVMNSVDERLLPPGDDSQGGRGFRVVYQGTITPHYGVHLLVEAVARIVGEVPETRLEIYGDGDSLPEVRSVARLHLGERVQLSGRLLPHQQVLERIRSASVGVVPNLRTPLNRFALSTKLFEYVALGIPVVSADLPTIREHFGDSEVLFFKAGDSDALAAALLEIRRDPRAAAARAKAALRRYEQYRWPANARRYAELLDRCLDPASARCGDRLRESGPTGQWPRRR